MLMAGCAGPKMSEDRRAGEPQVPDYVYYADAVLLRWTARQISQHGLTDLPNSKMIFLCGDSADGRYREVEVRKNDRPIEQMNPDTAPRLFTVRIDRHNGELMTDAAHFDGHTYPADGRFRVLVSGLRKRNG